mmetsp:Transcript_2733/g.7640  ORF Transcript_2733/g.7640 Transcript_2733/m.7640 type:complete len:921 (+) Transcript_2733:153-2915(+)
MAVPRLRQRSRLPTGQTNHNLTHFIKTVVLSGWTRLAALWILFFILLAGMDPGRSFYINLSSHVFEMDPKGGVPIANLALPILSTVSFVALGWTTSTTTTTKHSSGDKNLERGLAVSILPPSIVYFAMCVARHLVGSNVSNSQKVMEVANAFGVMALVMGSLWLVPLSSSKIPFVSALLGGNWVNDAMHRTRIHIWTGYVFLWGCLLHGGMHLYRFGVMLQGSTTLTKELFPPAECWQQEPPQKRARFCYNVFRNLTGFLAGLALVVILLTSLHAVRRSFYRLFYTAHMVAAPLVIVFICLHYNRAILYLAPSVLLYTATTLPSAMERWMAHFLSSSPPANNPQDDLHNSQLAVPIVGVESIGCNGTNTDNMTHMGLTVEASEMAQERFRAGQFVKVWVPEIDTLQSHPFTINIIPTTAPSIAITATDTPTNQLRIIFKVSGKFTTQLAQRLVAGSVPLPPAPPPPRQAHFVIDDGDDDDNDHNETTTGGVSHKSDANHHSNGTTTNNHNTATSSALRIHLQGFFGNSHRLEQALSHDVSLFVAGGIGITPYLSLLQHVQEVLLRNVVDAKEEEGEHNNNTGTATENPTTATALTQQVCLIWLCRERALVDYVKREYLDSLLEQAQEQGGYSLTITILHTGQEATYSDDTDAANVESPGDLHHHSTTTPREVVASQNGTSPFIPSRFASGSSTRIRSNLLNFGTVATICWVGLSSAWWCYRNMQDAFQIGSRIWALLSILVVGISVAAVANLIAALCDWDLRVDETVARRGAAFQPLPSDHIDGDGLFVDQDANHRDDRDGLMKRSVVVDDNDGNNIEMVEHVASEHGHNDEEDTIVRTTPTAAVVRLEERQGRGNMSELLYMDNAKRPGVFACGPPGFMREVRKQVAHQQKYRHGGHQCTETNPHEYQRIALYEEAFTT